MDSEVTFSENFAKKRILSYSHDLGLNSLEDAFVNEIKYTKLFFSLAKEFSDKIVVPEILSVDYKTFTFVMQKCDGKNLIEGGINEELLDILEKFLKHCESKGVYHNDIHERNIMFTDSKIWLIDFGMSAEFDLDSRCGISEGYNLEVLFPYFRRMYAKK